METISSLFDAFALVFDLRLLGFLLAGVLMGITLGILPGLGGIAGMSILIAVPISLSGLPARHYHGDWMIAVIPTSDTFASVLLGIPGSSSSQATVLDGFPLAKQGKAAQALSSAFVSSLWRDLRCYCLNLYPGGRNVLVTAIRSPAQFMLALFGISLVGIFIGQIDDKGLYGCGFGGVHCLYRHWPFHTDRPLFWRRVKLAANPIRLVCPHPAPGYDPPQN